MSDSPGWTFAPNVLDDALRMIGGAVSDLVPPDAQVHLLNAQRELLLALAIILEHNRARATGKRRGSTRGKPSRVELE
jgi:hypothetical protein